MSLPSDLYTESLSLLLIDTAKDLHRSIKKKDLTKHLIADFEMVLKELVDEYYGE